MTRRRHTPPDEVRKINDHARGCTPCEDCAAAPGQPCANPGSGRTVHKSRYIAAAIALRQEASAARRTPERDAILSELARLPKVPRPEIEACRTPSGGYRFNRETLARWGVPWPPPAGWRKAIEEEDDTACSTGIVAETTETGAAPGGAVTSAAEPGRPWEGMQEAVALVTAKISGEDLGPSGDVDPGRVIRALVALTETVLKLHWPDDHGAKFLAKVGEAALTPERCPDDDE